MNLRNISLVKTSYYLTILPPVVRRPPFSLEDRRTKDNADEQRTTRDDVTCSQNRHKITPSHFHNPPTVTSRQRQRRLMTSFSDHRIMNDNGTNHADAAATKNQHQIPPTVAQTQPHNLDIVESECHQLFGAHHRELETKLIAVPTHRDVLNGRGQGAQRHPGNVIFRALVFANKVRYSHLFASAHSSPLSLYPSVGSRHQDAPFLANAIKYSQFVSISSTYNFVLSPRRLSMPVVLGRIS